MDAPSAKQCPAVIIRVSGGSLPVLLIANPLLHPLMPSLIAAPASHGGESAVREACVVRRAATSRTRSPNVARAASTAAGVTSTRPRLTALRVTSTDHDTTD